MQPADTFMGMPAVLFVLIVGIAVWLVLSVIFIKGGGDEVGAFGAAGCIAAVVTFVLIYLFATM